MSESLKLLWIGENLGPVNKKRVLDNGGKLLSALVSEDNLIKGIDAQNVDMDSINSCQVSVTCLVPRNRIKLIYSEKWSRNGKSQDISVAYRNVKYVDMLFRTKALCREAKNWANKNRQEKNVAVIVYDMHSPYMRAAIEIKKILKNAKIYLIVTDLPLYMDLSMSKVKSVLKKIDWVQIQHLMKKIDKYILYAKPMASYLGLNDEDWLLMEGSYDSDLFGAADYSIKSKKNVVMYSGVLFKKFGIEELLDAMNYLDDTFELWITGNGDAVDQIKQKSKEDSRIKYYGYLPSRKDLLDKQASATMLISTRKKEEIASKYCFPSKLFEYMASGNPVISCYLGGIPEEYHQYLIELEKVTPEQIAQAIMRVAAMGQKARDEFGERAKKYIMEKKNKYYQAERIVSFIKSNL